MMRTLRIDQLRDPHDTRHAEIRPKSEKYKARSGHELEMVIAVDLNTCTTAGVVVNEPVANALEHALPSGRGQIEVSLTAINNGSLEVRVADDGIRAKIEDWNGTGFQTARRLITHVRGSLTLSSAPRAVLYGR